MISRVLLFIVVAAASDSLGAGRERLHFLPTGELVPALHQLNRSRNATIDAPGAPAAPHPVISLLKG